MNDTKLKNISLYDKMLSNVKNVFFFSLFRRQKIQQQCYQTGIKIFPNPVLRDLTTQNFTAILPNIFENVIYPSNFTT